MKPKIIVTKEIIKKIKYLCTLIPNEEWSGVLLYSMEGTIKDVGNVVITLRDILPLDKGSSTSTKFNYDERHINYLMKFPERRRWLSGLIHSHNNMAVFFSGEDTLELSTNSKNHNFYLSVVVNNRMDIIAKIAIMFYVDAVTQQVCKALDENGNSFDGETLELKVKYNKVLTYDCDIEVENSEEDFDTEFLENLSSILQPKKTTFNTTNKNFNTINNTFKKVKKVSKKDIKDFLCACLGDETEKLEVLLEEIGAVVIKDFEEGFYDNAQIVESFSTNFNYFFNINFDASQEEFVVAECISILSQYEDRLMFIPSIINFLKEIQYVEFQ